MSACGSTQTSSKTTSTSGSSNSSQKPTNSSAQSNTTTTANANSSSSFYQGKTLNIIVPYGPGGGYDEWARLISPYMKKYLGVSKVDVINTPGGGGLVGANKIYAAKPDGLTIGDINAGGDVFDQINGTAGVNFDVTKYTWIGRPDGDPLVLAVPKNSPYSSFDSLLKVKGTKKVIKALATGKGDSNYSAEVITFNAFKIPFKMIAAFSGSKEEKAAFLQGSGDITSLSANDAEQMGNNANIITILDTTNSLSNLSSTPTIIDEAKKAGLTANDMTALKSMANVVNLGHAFAAPPGIPQDRVSALQDAFKKTLNDPSFIAQAKKSHLVLGFKAGPELSQIAKQAITNSQSLKNYLKTN